MNSIKTINNFLIDVTELDDDYLVDLYKLCLKKVQKGFLVLIITSKKYDFTPLLRKIKITKEQTKCLIVINYTKVDDVSNKLMDLHDWTMLPSLVVVDISGLIAKGGSTIDAPTSLMKSITLCAVSYLDYLNSILVQKEKSSMDVNDTASDVSGLFIVKSDESAFSVSNLELLRSLYFYKSESMNDLKELPKLMKNASQ